MFSEKYLAAYFISLAIRIIISNYCINKSRKLNRNEWIWGFFGFVLPIVAVIWIQFMKPRLDWEINPGVESKGENAGRGGAKSSSSFNKKEVALWLGVILITVGLIGLIPMFTALVDLSDLWPIILIVIGFLFLLRKMKKTEK